MGFDPRSPTWKSWEKRERNIILRYNVKMTFFTQPNLPFKLGLNYDFIEILKWSFKYWNDWIRVQDQNESSNLLKPEIQNKFRPLQAKNYCTFENMDYSCSVFQWRVIYFSKPLNSEPIRFSNFPNFEQKSEYNLFCLI